MIEFERHPGPIPDQKGAPLEFALDEVGRQTLGPEPVAGLVEVVLAPNLEADDLAARLPALPQHHAMMIALLDAAQKNRGTGFMRRRQAQRVDPIGSGPA